jgi:hypothetical protein
MNALAVVQDYQLQLAVGVQRQQRDNYQVTFRVDEKFKILEPALRVVKDNVPIIDYSGWDEQQRGEFDCFFSFDDSTFQRAEKIALTIGSNIVHGLNVLVGAGASEFPSLTALQLNVDSSMRTNVLIQDWNNVESEKLYEYIFNNYPQLDMILDPRKWEDEPAQDIIDYINHFDCVIGPMGLGTYIAGSIKKVVLELFTSNEDGTLHGAAGTPNYFAVVGKHHTAAFLWTVWERNIWPCLEERLLETKSPEKSGLTA